MLPGPGPARILFLLSPFVYVSAASKTLNQAGKYRR